MIEDGLRTPTSEAQHSLEQHLISILKDFDGSTADQVDSSLELVRARHVEYLHEGLRERKHHIALGCSRPWLCYWITHSLSLLRASFPSSVPQIGMVTYLSLPSCTVVCTLPIRPLHLCMCIRSFVLVPFLYRRACFCWSIPGTSSGSVVPITSGMRTDVINFLQACQSPTGGFGGAPSQLPHLAPTYAAVSTLVTIGEEAALSAIDRVALLAFVRRMCVPPEAGGGIAVSEGAHATHISTPTKVATALRVHAWVGHRAAVSAELGVRSI